MRVLKWTLFAAIAVFSSQSFADEMDKATIEYRNYPICRSYTIDHGSSGYKCSFYDFSVPIVDVQSLMQHLKEQDARIQALEARLQVLESR